MLLNRWLPTNNIKLIPFRLINPVSRNLYRSSVIGEFIAAEVTLQYAYECRPKGMHYKATQVQR